MTQASAIPTVVVFSLQSFNLSFTHTDKPAGRGQARLNANVRSKRVAPHDVHGHVEAHVLRPMPSSAGERCLPFQLRNRRGAKWPSTIRANTFTVSVPHTLRVSFNFQDRHRGWPKLYPAVQPCRWARFKNTFSTSRVTSHAQAAQQSLAAKVEGPHSRAAFAVFVSDCSRIPARSPRNSI
jgi:hypothetical protein